jgi:hypothetical protein
MLLIMGSFAADYNAIICGVIRQVGSWQLARDEKCKTPGMTAHIEVSCAICEIMLTVYYSLNTKNPRVPEKMK